MAEEKEIRKAEEIRPQEYVEVDKNLTVETVFPDAEDAVLHSVREDPFELYNLWNPKTESLFRRLPAEVGEAVSPQVARLSREPAGARVRFSTDSDYILLKAVEPVVGRNSHMTLAMSAGFDLYEDTATDHRFIKAFMPPYKMEGGYEQIVRLGSRKHRYFTVHFPLHSQVSELYIGLRPDATLGEGKKYVDDKPIVIYGSSIVHGTGACRPGLCYSNILCRHLNRDVINLGFSGNAKAEIPMMEYAASLDMSVFVYDYDHNAPNPEYLQETHKRGYDIVRAAHPDVPIVLITRPNPATNPSRAMERKDVVIDTYRAARDAGDKNVWYIDGESFFLGKWENDCTLDGVHPNDLGYAMMVDGIECEIRRILQRRPADF